MGKKPKIVREGKRDDTVATVVAEVCDRIRALSIPAEVATSQIVREIYLEKGYEYIPVGGEHGWVWSCDGGVTYAVDNKDEFDIFYLVVKRLQKEFWLDFSKYAGMIVELPYSIPFRVRPKWHLPKPKVNE